MPIVSPLENTDIVEGRGYKVSREEATVKTEKEERATESNMIGREKAKSDGSQWREFQDD